MAANQADQADKLAKGSKVQKATVTLMRKLDGYPGQGQRENAAMLTGAAPTENKDRLL